MSTITASKIIETAKKEIGISEDPTKINCIKYNTVYYGGPVSGEKFTWDVTLIWWIFFEAGASESFCYGEKTSYAPKVKNRYEINKCFYTDPIEYRPGDIVVFDWSGTRKQAETVGLITDVDLENECVYTIEAVSGTVTAQKRHFSYITGVCRPDYNSNEDPNETSTDENFEVSNEQASESTENSCSDKNATVFEKALPSITKPDESENVDLDLVTVCATKKIYSKNTTPFKLSRSFLALRVTDSFGGAATGKININGYEFSFEGTALIPSAYLKSGTNTIALTASDGNVYVSNSFYMTSNSISPFPILHDDLVLIAATYEKVLRQNSEYEARIAKLEKAYAGVDFSDITLSDESLEKLVELLGKVAEQDEKNTEIYVAEDESAESENTQ